MNKVYLSETAHPKLRDYMQSCGYKICNVFVNGNVTKEISSHPDLYYCKMGSADGAFVFEGNISNLEYDYPGNVKYNAACTGKYFIHNLKYTDEKLLSLAKKKSMVLVDVKQGFTKCNVLIVDDNSIITSDKGIEKAFPGDVLLISSGNILLAGYDYGFIGGASGRVGKEIVFNGDLSKHPDFNLIVAFIKKRGLKPVWFNGYILNDIGSIIA